LSSFVYKVATKQNPWDEINLCTSRGLRLKPLEINKWWEPNLYDWRSHE